MPGLLQRLVREHGEVVGTLAGLTPAMDALAVRATATLHAGRTLLLIGNGGSAALCQHIATELVARFRRERAALAALALTADSALLTAVANDSSFDTVFARQIEALARPGDLLLAASTSGDSENVVRGVQAARERGCATAALLGRDGGRLRALVDIAVVVPDRRVDRIQECHLLLAHCLCDEIERAFGDAD